MIHPDDILFKFLDIQNKFYCSSSSNEYLIEKFEKSADNLFIYLSPYTPTYNRSTGKFTFETHNLIVSLGDFGLQNIEKFQEILNDLSQWEFEQGYRPNILTLQEKNLLGSSPGKTMHPVTDNYTPCGLFDGKGYTIEEINHARSLERFTTNNTVNFLFQNPTYLGEVLRLTLEPLDEKGRTIRDPRPVDANLELITEFSYPEDFPFRRL